MMTTTEQQIGALQADVNRFKDDMKEMRGDMKEVRDILNEAQGYWKMLVIIAGVAGAIGAFAHWIVSSLSAILPHP